MRRLSQLLITVATIATGVGPAYGDDGSKVLMYVTEGSRDLELMLTQEVDVMRQMLEDAGYTVDIATTSDQVLTSESATLAPTLSLSELDIDNYAGVILPCMAPAPGESPTPEEIARLLEAAVAQNKPIAASRGSVERLAEAGGVAGRQYAYASPVDTSKQPGFAGGTYVGIGVVRDGNISTAGICPLASRSLGEPDGTVELTQNFIASLAESS